MNGEDLLKSIEKKNQEIIKEKEKNDSNLKWGTCCLCGKKISEYEWNNPWPLENNFPEGTAQEEIDANWKVCCNDCNDTKVMPAREKKND